MVKRVIIGFGILNLLAFLLVFKKPYKKQRYKKYDCAIICGDPANIGGEPSTIMKSWVEMGVTLYKKERIKFLILSGGAVKNEYQEAKIMASYAISLGVKKEDILIEGQSRSTYHNLMYSRDIMQINGLKNALVVTNSWHLRKADHYARKFKLDYAMVSASAPKSYCWIKVVVLHLGTNIKMYYNLFKGYY